MSFTVPVTIYGCKFNAQVSKFYPQRYDSPAEGGQFEGSDFTGFADAAEFFATVADEPKLGISFATWLESPAVAPLFHAWVGGVMEETITERAEDPDSWEGIE